MVAVGLFLFAVQLLGGATEALSPLIERLLRRALVGPFPALGIGWLASYLLANGSVVAALAVSLFAADLVTPTELFLLVSGSRLGAAGVVLFIGALDFLARREAGLRESLRLGVLTFVCTYAVFVPSTVVGYLALPWADPLVALFSGVTGLLIRSLSMLRPVALGIVDQLGATGGFLLAVVLLLVSLRLFDRTFARLDTDHLRDRYFGYLSRVWLSFLAGLLLTGITTSITFSLGVVVPLYNREYLTRRETVPYILGANIGTFSDTLVVAVVLESPVAVATVAAVMGLGLAVTLVALLRFEWFYRRVRAIQMRIVTDRRVFVAFLLGIGVVPLGLTLLRTG